MLNLVVWNKSNAGQGSFYRSQHELIGVFRVGEHPHRNNVELGRFGRNRSNVWTYAGVNTFGRGRMEALAVHPTVKPTALVADALLDCTARGDSVLDQCAGSGTIFLAADKVGRVAYGLEIEPRYVDVAILRWQQLTKLEATLDGDGRTFEEIKRARARSKDPPGAALSDPAVGQSQSQQRTHRGKNSWFRWRSCEPRIRSSAVASRKRKSLDGAVGYGRPPKASQFKKGQSGNPRGRPKGSSTRRGGPAGDSWAKDSGNRERQDAALTGARGHAAPARQRRHAQRARGLEINALAVRPLWQITGSGNPISTRSSPRTRLSWRTF